MLKQHTSFSNKRLGRQRFKVLWKKYLRKKIVKGIFKTYIVKYDRFRVFINKGIKNKKKNNSNESSYTTEFLRGKSKLIFRNSKKYKHCNYSKRFISYNIEFFHKYVDKKNIYQDRFWYLNSFHKIKRNKPQITKVVPKPIKCGKSCTKSNKKRHTPVPEPTQRLNSIAVSNSHSTSDGLGQLTGTFNKLSLISYVSFNEVNFYLRWPQISSLIEYSQNMLTWPSIVPKNIVWLLYDGDLLSVVISMDSENYQSRSIANATTQRKNERKFSKKYRKNVRKFFWTNLSRVRWIIMFEISSTIDNQLPHQDDSKGKKKKRKKKSKK